MYNRKSIFFVALVVLTIAGVSGFAYYVSLTPTSTASFAKTEKQKALVSAFPAVPVYPRAAIENSYVKSEGGRTGYEANWISRDKVFQVMNWYLEALVSDGWSLTTAPQEPRTVKVTDEYAVFAKGNLTLILNIAQEGRLETEIHMEFPLQNL